MSKEINNMTKLTEEPDFYLEYTRYDSDRTAVKIGRRVINEGLVRSLCYDNVCESVADRYYVEINEAIYNRLKQDYSEMVRDYDEMEARLEGKIEELQAIIDTPWYTRVLHKLFK